MKKWLRKKLQRWLGVDDLYVEIRLLDRLYSDLVTIGVDVHVHPKNPHNVWIFTPLIGMHFVETDENVFFTFKDYEEHIRLNSHNYQKVHSYVKHAFRNPEMKSLLEAIMAFADTE